MAAGGCSSSGRFRYGDLAATGRKAYAALEGGYSQINNGTQLALALMILSGADVERVQADNLAPARLQTDLARGRMIVLAGKERDPDLRQIPEMDPYDVIYNHA